eukprot:m.117817 g.117817  ORF g.117817 m.117817 type:complete len:211 (-) comp15436_c0_seq6:368-1000(-)
MALGKIGRLPLWPNRFWSLAKRTRHSESRSEASEQASLFATTLTHILAPLEDHEVHEGGVFSVARHRTYAVTGGGNGVVCVWSLQTGSIVHSLAEHQAEVYCVDINERVVVSGDAASQALVWDLKSGECLHRLNGHVGVVRHIKLVGSRVITGGDRRGLVVWDYHLGTKLHVVHRQPILLRSFHVSALSNLVLYRIYFFSFEMSLGCLLL